MKITKKLINLLWGFYIKYQIATWRKNLKFQINNEELVQLLTESHKETRNFDFNFLLPENYVHASKVIGNLRN